MIRNTKAVVSIAVVWILLGLLTGACEEKIDNISIIRTGAVTDISAEGATFRGNISQLGLEEVIDYGFVWSEEVYPTVDGYAKFFGEPPTIGEFEYLNSAGLRKDTTYYLRAFMQTSGSVIYGDVVTFKSLGGRAPVITGFEPNEGTYGSELTIKGDFFSDALAENIVEIGSLNCEIIRASRTELKVKVENGIIISGNYPLTVQVGNHKMQSADSFMMEGFQIDSISPIKGLANDDVQLWCKNAPQYYMQLSLIANGSSNDISGYHYAYSPTEIRFKIPYDFSFVGPAQVSVEFFDSEYNSAGVLLKEYEITGPQVLSFTPKEAFPGEKIFVNGQYLDRVGSISIGNVNSVLTLTSPESGSFIMSYATPPGEVPIDVNWVNSTKISSSNKIKVKSAWSFQGLFPRGAIANGTGFAIEGKLYAGLGSTEQNNSSLTADFWELDLRGNGIKRASFPGKARTNASSVASSTDGYIIGGKDKDGNALGDFWRYSPSSNTWVRLADFPGSARYDAITAAIGSDIYFGLGRPIFVDGKSPFKDIWKYNIDSRTWTQASTYPGEASQGLIYFTIGDILFVGGGINGDYSFSNTKDFWSINTKTNTWTRRGDLPIRYPSYKGASFVINGLVYITPDETYQRHLWKFDPFVDSWIRIPDMVFGNGSSNVFSSIDITLNNKGYIIGGYGHGPNGISDEIWEFDPSVF